MVNSPVITMTQDQLGNWSKINDIMFMPVENSKLSNPPVVANQAVTPLEVGTSQLAKRAGASTVASLASAGIS